MGPAIRNTGNVLTFFSKQVLEADRFYLGASAGTGRSLGVVCGGWERCGADYRVDRADFPFYCLEFVARGAGALTLQGRALSLRPGSVFSYGPGIAHVIRADPAAPLWKYFVAFTGRAGAKLLARYDLSPGTAVRVAAPEVVLRIFDDLITNGSSGTRQGPAICATLLELLILKIAEGGLIEDAHRMAAFSTYQGCRQFIQDHFATLWTLEEIADACHVDKAYLCRLFKRFDRQSPHQYLTQLKMTRAAQCLRGSERLVKEIAFELGFGDVFHFSRAFKKVFGLSPAAFRQLR